MPADVEDKQNRSICSLCEKEVHNPELTEAGNHVGNSANLGQAILKAKYAHLNVKCPSQHPLSTSINSAQAHHLICSESMNNDNWARICENFGYNINCIENGIFLPSDMAVACTLRIPLHRGNHSATEAGESMNYVDGVKGMIDPVKDAAMNKEFCDNPKEIISRLNQISKTIWNLVEDFAWTLTYDGFDYVGGMKGCMNMDSLRKKRKEEKKNPAAVCNERRKHDLHLIMRNEIFLEQR
ncbi:AHH domain-containing protein [Flavisolibacter ginsenosidimutans]|uniref:Uncharacterized protein n=1 Tax=Flavisolibacter ginsenosidimutans TaxID=661481 RepID=A0A5B8ULA3_9BACT|nr:AHH domain-containing protein [Flavisolibacter ginsenosidimutans]QEC56820.1 hypothetical protein FSB75_13235 [Flavisolibacter ginsenosidimutans]